MTSFQARFSPVVQSAACDVRSAALLGEPGLDRFPLVAAVASEPEVGEAALARRFPHPGLGDREELGYLACGQQALAHRSTSLPQAVQPLRPAPRQKSSSFVVSVYMRSISS